MGSSTKTVCRGLALALGGVLVASPALANWTLTNEGGGSYVLSGAADHADTLRAECGPNGTLSFAYIQPGNWEDVLGTIPMTLWTSTDDGPKHTMKVTAKKFGENGVAYTNDSDMQAIYTALVDVRNALVTIHLGVEAASYGVSWTDTSSAKDSTATTREFARKCGINIDKPPPPANAWSPNDQR
ncbi:hypothetical protein [Amorphus orientalis]|uniref:Uncharacterized protein n=1 Tax=Amorphus orientalis TaxID=649198 RepID=A0AAE3VLQ0_9HYPH|nr:hypothetical protein [Amorphus orientalis]MDQ0314288.1 hypothetical protein [Amorphus orientalis]